MEAYKVEETGLYDQLTTMTKAHNYDIVSKENEKLREENKVLKEWVKKLQDLIEEYTTKMLNNLK